MDFLNSCKRKAHNHHSQVHLTRVAAENQILLNKIIKAKEDRRHKEENYSLAMH